MVSQERAGRWPISFRPRFFVLVGFVVLVLGLNAGVRYTSSPSFCNSCHIMEPYYKAWASSKHNQVACVECHYPPAEAGDLLWKKFQAVSQVVKYVTQTYSSKPFAEVDDASCLRSGCHATNLLSGKLATEKGVLFDHKHHLGKAADGKELRCVSCHTQIVVGQHMEMDWSNCFLCHFKGHREGREIEPVGGCQGCHVLPAGEIRAGNITYNHRDFLGQHAVACQSCHQDVAQGDGRAPQDRCLNCHNQSEKLDLYPQTALLHESHIRQHGIACNHCHEEIRHAATVAGSKPLNDDCGVCHTDTHDIQKDFYRGLGAQGVAPMPSPMYLANVDCVGCHLAKKNGNGGIGHSETYLGSEKGCTDCHGEEYLGIVPEAQQMISEAGKGLQAKEREIRSALSQASPDGQITESLRKALEESSFNLKLLETARSAHNIYYAAQILRATNERLNGIAEEGKIAAPDVSDHPVISGAFCGTLCHSKVGVKVPPETVRFREKEMPHQKHIEEGMSCTQCHTFGTHKEVSLKGTEGCTLCHDEEEGR